MDMILKYNKSDGSHFGFSEKNDYINIRTGEIDIVGDYLIVDNELWQYLISKGKTFKIVGVVNNKNCYTISDKNLFEFIEVDQDKYTYESPMTKLEDENAELLLNSVKKEIEISNLQNDIADILLQLGGKVL